MHPLRHAPHRRLFTAVLPVCLTCAACAMRLAGDCPTLDKPVPGILLESDRAALPEGFQNRPVTHEGLALTKASEGFEPRLYNDPAGYCTVGYGHLVKKSRCDGAEPAQFRPEVSETSATHLLIDDMAQAQYAVMVKVRQSARLSDNQYSALVDFTFNVGAANFGRSTLLKLVNGHRFNELPREWAKWVTAGGKVYPGLARRRTREVELFFDGTPPQLRDAPPAGQQLGLIDIRRGE